MFGREQDFGLYQGLVLKWETVLRQCLVMDLQPCFLCWLHQCKHFCGSMGVFLGLKQMMVEVEMKLSQNCW